CIQRLYKLTLSEFTHLLKPQGGRWQGRRLKQFSSVSKSTNLSSNTDAKINKKSNNKKVQILINNIL
ncbi:MAG: hypothetical protein WBV73_19085, partial [Phormidium sp.]